MTVLRIVRRIALGGSLRGRFARVLVVTGLAPLLALSVLFLSSQRTDLEAVAMRNLASQAELQAAAVSKVIEHAGESIGVLAANPAIRRAGSAPEEVRGQLESYSLFDEVVLLHPMGFVLEATSYGFSGRWDANAAFRGALRGRQVMTPPLFYPNPDRLVVEFAAPVYDGPDIVSVVVGSMNMDRVWQVLDGSTVGRSGHYAAFDEHGNVIACPDKSKILSKPAGEMLEGTFLEAGPVRFRETEGQVLVGHVVRAGLTEWHIAAVQPEAEAFAVARDAQSKITLAALVALLLSASVALVLARVVSSPIHRVGQAMRRITEGDLDQRVESPGLDEINGLASSFNIMAGELEQRSRSLEVEMSERDRAEQRIRYQAHHDPLTGLPNRLLLKDRLDMAQASSRRTGEPLAVMFLDLDRFKLVNDSMGHAFGDELLLGVSDRITAGLREGDSVARVGGDEYVLLLPQVSDFEQALRAAERVVDTLRAPWELNGRSFHITASIGIAMFPGDGDDAETLMRNADTAMYQAKEEGRNGIRRFTPEMDHGVQERVALEHDLRRALANGQFVLHYQPQVEIKSGRVVGMEALLRWQSPERGLVMPDGFIPLAEETGLIWDLGRWVLQTACAQTQAWRDAGLARDMVVAVNVSARQFHDMGIVDDVRDTLSTTGLPAARLALEITESTAMRDVEHSVRTLARLKEMGVRVSIDDFGTGYSSLAYLKRFPVDTVKIDRSFVMDIADDADDAAIVGAIIALADSLAMRTVAEGVETEEQLQFLREHECASFQGFIFSQAIPAEEFAALLAADVPLQAASPGRKMPTLRPNLARS